MDQMTLADPSKNHNPFKSIGIKVRLLSAVLSVAFFQILTACSDQVLDVQTKSTNQIAGTAMMFKGATQGSQSLSSFSCSGGEVTLHAVNSDGSIAVEALATTSVDTDGQFVLQTKGLGLRLSEKNVQHVIQVRGCNQIYSRPVTAFKAQEVSGASTLLAMTSDLTEQGRRSLTVIERTDIDSLIAKIQTLSGGTLNSLLTSLIADLSTSQVFQNVTGISPQALKDLPPQIWTVTTPTSLHEGTTSSFSVSSSHWNPDYQEAYQWVLDGVLVSQTDHFSYVAGKNSQGKHTLVLKLGELDSNGILNASKPTRSQSISVEVSNDYPASAPALTLQSPAVSGSTPIGTRSITLAIDTGSSLANCDTFSSLAVTEGSASPPAISNFNISCATAGTQSVAYTLTSNGDGAKTLRLWAKDAADNISATPSTLTVVLDTAPPTVTLASVPSVSGSTSQSVSFTADDNGGSIDHFLCQLDGGTFTACSSPAAFSGLSQGSHTVAIKAVDSASNVSAIASATWIVDLTAPTATVTSAPNSQTNQAVSTFVFTGSDTGGGSLASFQCSLDGASWSTCISPWSSVLAAGSHSFRVRAIDTAGNISGAQSNSWVIDQTPPSVSIVSNPASPTNSTTASFSFVGVDSGGASVASYECSLDQAAFSSCSSPKGFSSLSAGTHNFQVRATDTAGNTGSPASFSWTIDLTTPIASISSNPSSLSNSSSASFSFSANAPPSGSIIGYECRLDSGSWSSCSSPVSYTSLTQGSHFFQVRAIDNNSNVSSTTSYSWTVDLTAPTLTVVTQPTALNNSTGATLEFSASDTGGASVAGFSCKLDTGAWASCSSPVNYSALAQGAHTVQITATDSAGNISSPTSATWTTDLTAPGVSITSSPSILTNLGTAGFGFSGTDSGGGSVASYECAVDGGTYSACTSPLSLNSLSAGAHTFAVRALDTAGNVGSAQTYGWTIDQTPPTASIISSPSLFSGSSSATFSFSISDTGGGSASSSQCSLDGGSYSTCTSPASYSSLSQGTHTFAVKGIDTAGNVGTPVTVNWTVDTIAPVVTITSPASNGGVIPIATLSTLTVSGTCESGLNVSVSGAATATAPCSSGAWSATVNVSSQTDGTLSLTASQTDAAGNIGSAVRTAVKDTSGPVITLTSTPTSSVRGGSATTIGFSVTESIITTAQSFTISYSTDNGATWNTAGSVASTAGPLSSTSFSYVWTTPSVDSSQVKVRVSGTDQAGNSGTSSASSSFVIDSTPPTLTGFVLAGGTTSVAQPTVTVDFTASDNLSGVSQYQINETGTYSGSAWLSYSTTVNYALSSVDGAKTVYAWVKDAAGNVSSPVIQTISLSSAIPSIAITGPTTANTYTSGQSVPITWTCSSTSALDPNPISISYSTDDGTTFTSIATGIANSGSYGWTLPSGVTTFRLLIGCKSVSGVVANSYSQVINTGGWSVYAGDPWYGLKNVAASIAKVVGTNTDISVAGDNDNNIYYVYDSQIMKIDGKSGLVTEFAGNGTTSCTLGTGVAALSGGLTSPTIIGLDSTRTGLFVAEGNCSKILRINLSDATVTTWATLPAGAVFPSGSGFNANFFLTKNRILLFASSTYFYRLDLSTQGNSAVAYMGDGTVPSGTATVNRYAAGTVVLGKQILSAGNGMTLFATADASQIWLAPYNFGNFTRYDWNGTAYQVGTADGGSRWDSYQSCIATDFDNFVYCALRAGNPGGTKIAMFDPSTGTRSSNIGQIPVTDNYQSGNMTLGSLKDRLLTYYNANSIDTAVPSWSGSWQYNHIAGQLLTVMGNGSDLSKVGFDRLIDIKYNAATTTLWLGTSSAYARRIVYSGSTATTSSVYSSTNGRNGKQLNFNLAGNKAVGVISCSRQWIFGDTFNSASPLSFTPSTGYYLGAGICDGTTYTYTYPPPSGATTGNALFVNNLDSVGNVVLASNGRAYFAGHNSSTATNDDFIFYSNGSTITRVAGVTGTGGYVSTDNGALASTAKLTRVWQMQEVASGSHQGDLLIWDGDRLRLITIATDSSAPKIYDLYSFTMAAGYTAGTTFYDAYYDSSSEISGTFGTGTIYYSTNTSTVHKFVPNAALTAATDTTYSFTGTTLTGGIRLALHPTDGLLILQANKNRILKIAP